MNKLLLREQLNEFFQEDIGFGDLTAQWIFNGERSRAVFLAKEAGVFSGKDVLIEGYKLLQEEIDLRLKKGDGDALQPGDIIAEVVGPTADLLCTERVLLNLVQRMSGIATMTANVVRKLSDTTTKVCDTRKTTPGLRMLEKHAVTCGGGFNHRLRLDDAVMIKDNHIAQAGSITAAMERIRQKIGHMVKVEVEVESLGDLQEAIAAKADVIMFDNCSVEEARLWRELTPATIITEVSGGMTMDNVQAYGETGVEYISIGALTHSVKALDISFNIEVNGGTKYGKPSSVC